MAIDKINFDGTEIEIPRKTSQLTNDNNFITLPDIPTASNATLGLIKLATIQEITDGTNETNAVTPKQLKTAIEGIGTVFDLKGSVDTLGDLPTENNEIGDVWYVKSESVGYIWLNDGTENRWEQLGPSINLSNYVQITDIVNDLTTDNIEKPLSAYQGKVLNESILNVSQSIPTNTSQLTNDSGYITGYTETDPTVPSWAKQSTKPTYTYSEITEKPTLATVAISGSYDDLTNKPNIPSAVTVDSALSTTSENPVQNKVVTSAINTAQGTADTANTNAQNAQSTANTALTTANGAVSKNTEQDNAISALQTADGQNVKLTGNQSVDGVKNFTGTLKVNGTSVYEKFMSPPDPTISFEITKNSTYTPDVNGYILCQATANDKNGAYFRIRVETVDGMIICGTLGATGKSLGYNSAPSMICPVKKGYTYYIEASASYYKFTFVQAY